MKTNLSSIKTAPVYPKPTYGAMFKVHSAFNLILAALCFVYCLAIELVKYVFEERDETPR